MRQLPSQEELRRLKAVEAHELARRREWEIRERRGLEEAFASYWGLLEDFVARAREVGIQPRRHEPAMSSRAARVKWVDGYRLRGGSIVTAPPLRYSIRERRLGLLPREEIHEVEEVTLLVASTDAALTVSLNGPMKASQKTWPPIQRWDRAANVLNALEAELKATLLELMQAG